MSYPQRIICITEEGVEWLYKLGQEDKIVGVSAYVERPTQAKKDKKVVSSFVKANLKSIRKLKPDLILGYSDIQKDIARDLIGEGFNVWISNHRSLEDVLNYLLALGSLVGERDKSLEIISEYRKKMDSFKEKTKELIQRPKIYIEEWDEPMISGIQYFSELIDVCGGENIFKDRERGFLAKDRFVDSKEVIERDPDAIFACWCGKKVDMKSFSKRAGWEKIKAVKN
ncbi:MAG: ABC transporter substrate-binding protein, partial [Bdellovibrionales bacterium]|nr:ABC transporter substrate-binding protein [Bdellovibrionales bacterium]